MPKNAIRRAIAFYGSEEKLGLAIGYSQRAINHAAHVGHCTPEMAFRIHVATKGRVKAKELCPELNFRQQLELTRKQMNGRAR